MAGIRRTATSQRSALDTRHSPKRAHDINIPRAEQGAAGVHVSDQQQIAVVRKRLARANDRRYDLQIVLPRARLRAWRVRLHRADHQIPLRPNNGRDLFLLFIGGAPGAQLHVNMDERSRKQLLVRLLQLVLQLG